MSKRTEELVRMAKSGDNGAFGELYSENSDKLLKYIIGMNVKQADAEDIMSETFMDAMTHIGDLKNEEAFSSWLFTIAKRKVYAHTKDTGRRVEAVIKDDSAYNDGVSELADRYAYEGEDIYGNTVMLPSDYAENEEVRELVVATISSLSEEQRTVIYGYYYDGKTSAELAEELGVNENTVRSRIKYAKQHIEKKLKELQKSGVVLSAVPISRILALALENSKRKAIVAAGGATAAAAGAGSGTKIAAAIITVAATIGIGIGVVTFGKINGDKGLKDSLPDSGSETVTTTVTTTRPAPEEESEAEPDSLSEQNESGAETERERQEPTGTASSNEPDSPQTGGSSGSRSPAGTQPGEASPAEQTPAGTGSSASGGRTTTPGEGTTAKTGSQGSSRGGSTGGNGTQAPSTPAAGTTAPQGTTSPQETAAETKPARENDTTPVLYSGNCGANGDNIKWELHESGTLYLYGEGEMPNSTNYWTLYGSSATYFYGEKFSMDLIKNVVVGEGITSIYRITGGYTESIDLPRSLKTIYKDTIILNNMKTIFIPANVEIIEDNLGVTMIDGGVSPTGNGVNEEIIVDPNNKYYSSYDGVLYNKDQTELLRFPIKKNSVVFPGTLKTMASGAFNQAEIKTVVVPNGVTDISTAFRNSRVNSITLPNTITRLESHAFDDSRIETFNLPDSLRYIGDWTFYGCYLENIVIPNGVTYIGSCAFRNCFELKSVTIPDSVTTINGAYVFYFDNNTGKNRLDEFRIICNKGSYAETYANKNDLPVEYLT
ncbi:MAG: sigma-70 family RNA polymerase sigma factor [Ruminococcus sp.]|nr:sigma-70 family RNA polymerase sigma factor [Ruminococcus sp.]